MSEPITEHVYTADDFKVLMGRLLFKAEQEAEAADLSPTVAAQEAK